MTTLPRTAIDVIAAELAPLRGRTILDIGCGKGVLRAPLETLGARWHGLDPLGTAADLPIDTATAEAMPYPDASFDAAICVNALHHVPVPAMPAALSEAARVLRNDGVLLVIEPRATGALSQVIAVVDDETALRNAAQTAMDRTGALFQTAAYDYERVEGYADFEAFCTSLIDVDPGRRGPIAARRAALHAAFDRMAGHDGPRRTLTQTMSVRVFRPH